ncbi:MAG: hypothetical protein GWN00_02520 [Aliifodinibius sp.]|nr:hypothetical protein [candidate division Zixibacteria bacterium]NIT55145.1 hypothetical protein [Fodinibius sp.]NIS44662.1 hypothetical protein [candidate division Zixibacteria bacterium]NIU12719.1 hypothetical protein [candidate division Zixibacteria bacterium]NIV04824.1 hypothetical protein [candidate division Zixibacteria bacterium]
MRKTVWLAFAAITLFFVSSALGQTEASATKVNDEDVAVSSQKAQKTAKMRKVVRVSELKLLNVKKGNAVRYDEKGGIVRPNASKGFKQKNLSQEQRLILQRYKNQGTATQEGAVKVSQRRTTRDATTKSKQTKKSQAKRKNAGNEGDR